MPQLLCFFLRIGLLFAGALLLGGWLAATVCAPTAHAEIVWAQKSANLQADAGSTILEARFPFSNHGPSPVDITQVESSCGCTTVALDKRRYAPGEAGVIVAKYTVGSAVGAQKKTVLVETNDGKEPTTLTLNIQVPEILRIQPPFVSWNYHEALAPKTIILEMLQNVPVKDISVKSSCAGIEAKLEPVVPGRKYALRVMPQNTGQHQFSSLEIRCRFGDEDKVFKAYAVVRPPDGDE